ncbi:hypothetical protein [uncultured Parasutterella sp.]|nr:hypothetical protein [uncultured Parasutterella sp.]
MIYSYDIFNNRKRLSTEERKERLNSIRRERYEIDAEYREKQLGHARKYIENNREKRNARRREIWHKNGDQNRKALRDRYWDDPEKWRERNRKYYELHKEEICAKKRAKRQEIARLTQGPKPLHPWVRAEIQHFEEREIKAKQELKKVEFHFSQENKINGQQTNSNSERRNWIHHPGAAGGIQKTS